MAALRLRAAFFLLLLLLLEVCVCERHGSPATFITVARAKRSGPTTVTADAAPHQGTTGPHQGTTGPHQGTTGPHQGHPGPHRARRSVENPSLLPLVEAFALNDSHHQVMIDWAGEGSDVVVCVTRDAVQNKTSVSNVFISYDYGSSFKNGTSKFITSGGKPATINKFYKNDKYTSRFVFTDVINKYMYLTLNNGINVTSLKVKFTPSEVTHHPVDADVLLVYDTKDGERKLWISEDFGENWRIVERYVKSYFWSEATSPPTLYVEREEPSGSASVVSSQYLFSESSVPITVITDVEDFEVKDEFLFAVKKVHLLGSPSRESTLQMWVSYQGGPFLRAEFPNGFDHIHYYVADISEGQVMVCVAHDGFISNLYVSSVPRSARHQVRFSLSLERIVFFNPSTNWVDTWLSAVVDKAFADLHRIEGVRGVFIASQLAANFNASHSKLGPEHVISYVTFDQGAQWKPLQPPRKDLEGNPFDCERAKGCSLQVSQELSHLYPAALTMPILSKASAPGLILATGTIGKSLKGHTSLFVSTDAGINWYQVLYGNYMYTFGDHGGIIVAVQLFRGNGETNEIQYSTNEGETWLTYTFYSERIRVYGLMTEPGENTTIFTLFGSKSKKHQWIIVKVDMKSVFESKCTVDDYKTWSPSDGRSGRMCLLGRKQVYERRVPRKNCFNGISYDRPISVENCPCDREDFECDFGFADNMTSHECIKDKEDRVDPYAVPNTCKPGHFYNRTKGYRRIPGDTCEGGREYQYEPSMTACPVNEVQEFLLVSARQEILRYDLLNPEGGLEPLPIPNLKMVIALDFDMAANCIYWSDVEEKKINRLCFDGEHDVETLVDRNTQSVEGLAFDWISKNLYFVDGELKTVEVIRTDISHSGRMRRMLLNSSNLDNPRGIAVHPVRGYLYITDWSESSPKVARAFLDGTNFTILFGVNTVGWPNGIAIDFQTDRIFFADARRDYIASADLDGRNMKTIISHSEKVMQPFALGVYKSTVFWDDWTVYQVLQADKEHGWGIAPIANITRKGLVDLKVFGFLSQQGTNSCGNQTTSCTHLCMGRPNNQFACLCPDGMKRQASNIQYSEECQCPDGSPIQENGTCRPINNSTCPENFFMCKNRKCIPKQWLCDKDDDCGDFSDEGSPECEEKSCDPLSWKCLNGHCIAPSWRCDHDDDCGDNSDEQECQYDDCPKSTFTCANRRCIHLNWQCDMEDDCRDGSDEVNCTSTNRTQCKVTEFKCAFDGRCLPSSWRCDGDSDCPDSSDEQNCETYSCEEWQFQCLNKQCIFSSWKCDGEADCSDGSDEIGCDNVTTTTPQSSIPLGPLLPPTNLNCTEFMFRCTNKICIPFWWRCDGLDDCGDASDEDGCSQSGAHANTTTTVAPTTPVLQSCQKDQFQCTTGSCIWETWVCDTDLDCPGGEDEENCHQTSTCVDLEEFQCRRTGGCIPSKRLCDGQEDCADGSDEEGCSTTLTPTARCPYGFFMCDGGACEELFKHCDGNHDCVDLTDEQNCSSNNDKAFLVTGFTVVQETNTSVKVKWEVNNREKVERSLEFMPSLIVKAALGNPSAWHNISWTSNTSYEFDGLEPYTAYVLKVYVREKNGSQIFPPIKSRIFHTQEGIPSPPEGVKVEQLRDRVKVSWSPPIHPNGPIKQYRVYVSPPNPAREVRLPGGVNQLIIHSKLIDSNVIRVWVTVTNEVFTSEPSETIEFVREPFENATVQVCTVSSTTTSASLTWDPVPGVDGYIISHSRPENEYLSGKITNKTSDTRIEISDLAPGKHYVFEVRAYKGQLLGPDKTMEVITQGQPLVAVESLQAVVMKDVGTTVKLSWSEPPYKTKKIPWTYRIVWGKTANDLKHSANVATSANTTYVIRGLEACETYLVAVMVEGPIGIGPVSEKLLQTVADPLAPPKNLHARLENMTLVITWEPSCPQSDNDDLHYLLIITDIIRRETSNYMLEKQDNHTQRHSVRAHWGGLYSISVCTSLARARLSRPVICPGPVIPPPYDLTYNPSDGSFFWRRNRTLSHDILAKNISYVLYIARHRNMSDSKTYKCSAPPLIVNDLSLGVIYYAAVALKDADGYLSEQSQFIRVEKPLGDEVVLSQKSVAGVGVSVFLVVGALIVVVAVLAVRHRRLARSFLTFANTHYDRSQGTTLITTDHNLDEDDDSPMIRGFSDDEPLVIA